MGTRLPPSNAQPDGRRYESGTDWEYEDAKHGGKDVFVYLRTDAPPASADNRAREQLAKVRRFVDSFRNPDGSLAGFVQEFGERSPLEPLLDKQMQGVVRRWVERAERRRALARFGATASVLALVGAGILIRVVTRPHVTFSLADSCTLRRFGDQQRGRLRVTYAVEGQSAAWARAQLALYAANAGCAGSVQALRPRGSRRYRSEARLRAARDATDQLAARADRSDAAGPRRRLSPDRSTSSAKKVDL